MCRRERSSPFVNPNQYAIEEIGAALCLTRRKADYELGVALDLRHSLIEVASALDSGRIDVRRAALLSRDTSHLDANTRSEIASKILEAASDLTTGQIAARVRNLAIEADSEAARNLMELSSSSERWWRSPISRAPQP